MSPVFFIFLHCHHVSEKMSAYLWLKFLEPFSLPSFPFIALNGRTILDSLKIAWLSQTQHASLWPHSTDGVFAPLFLNSLWLSSTWIQGYRFIATVALLTNSLSAWISFLLQISNCSVKHETLSFVWKPQVQKVPQVWGTFWLRV